jgi:catechol 2,3-dioxygenase-like lactoylglutathione lyase family enzyme
MEQSLATTERLAITGVSHIEFHVSDLEASTEWYMLAVGLTKLKAAPGKFAELTPEGGGFRLGLSEQLPIDHQFGHLAIALTSMDVLLAWVDHLDAIGVPHTAIKENPFKPGVFSIDLHDPDGHEIELVYEPRPPGTSQI